MKIHSPDNQHTCPICSKPFVCAAYLARHQRVHFKQIQEPGSTSTGNIYSVKTRTWVPPENRSFPCHVCSSSFSRVSSLTQHIKRNHPSNTPNTNTTTCAICNKSFTCQSSLREHLQTHLVGNQSRKLTEGKRRSRKRKWVPPVRKPFACSMCSSSFMLENTLNKHIKLHSTN